MKTYRGVDGLIALEAAILAKAMVCLAESDAGNAPGHQAGIDGAQASKETVGPWLGGLG